MAESTLVAELREAGWKLLERLDIMPSNITDAFWTYVEDEDLWRLVIATPLVKTDGPIKTYQKIRETLDSMPVVEKQDLSLSDIALISPDSLFLDQMRRAYGRVRRPRGMHIRRTSITKDEPFVYRLS